jgi:hypothetical protein
MELLKAQAHQIEIGLLIVALIPPLLLGYWARQHGHDTGATPPRPAFLQIPYITWFILHMFIAFYGILAVVLLAVIGVINGSTVGTLLGGLFGYVLGAATHSSPAQGGTTPAAAGSSDKTPAAS